MGTGEEAAGLNFAGGARAPLAPVSPRPPQPGQSPARLPGSPSGLSVTGMACWGPPPLLGPRGSPPAISRASLRPDTPGAASPAPSALNHRRGLTEAHRERTPGFGTGRAAPQDSEPARPRPSARRVCKPLGSQLPRLQGRRGREAGRAEWP